MRYIQFGLIRLIRVVSKIKRIGFTVVRRESRDSFVRKSGTYYEVRNATRVTGNYKTVKRVSRLDIQGCLAGVQIGISCGSVGKLASTNRKWFDGISDGFQKFPFKLKPVLGWGANRRRLAWRSRAAWRALERVQVICRRDNPSYGQIRIRLPLPANNPSIYETIRVIDSKMKTKFHFLLLPLLVKKKFLGC